MPADPEIDPANTALLVIDVQEDFCSPVGAAGQWGIDLRTFEAPLARIHSLIAAAREREVAIVFVRVISRPETDTAALKTLHRSLGHPPEALAICRADTSGADYYQVAPQPGDIEIEKTLYSSFVGTDLEAQLRARGIDTLVVAGFTTECCVDCTIRDGFHRNFNCLLVTDACAAYEPALHDGAIAALSKNCALLTHTDAVSKAWGSAPNPAKSRRTLQTIEAGLGAPPPAGPGQSPGLTF